MTRTDDIQTYDDLPRAQDAGRGTPSALWKRRDFLGRTGAVGAGLVIGTQFLDALGNRVFANGHPSGNGGWQCSFAGLYYRPDCNGNQYASCSGGREGCARVTTVSSVFFCKSTAFGSRHRSCNDSTYPGGNEKKYEIRTNACYGDGADGWKWNDPLPVGGSTCGCSNQTADRLSSCNDGWYSTNGGTCWAPSICETYQCLS